jgi:short-subunit dehydrogenase
MEYEITAMLAGRGGAIVNTASEAANHPSPQIATYVVTKAVTVHQTSAAGDFARE